MVAVTGLTCWAGVGEVWGVWACVWRGAACMHLAWWPELSVNSLTLASTVHAAVVAAVEATAAAQHEKLLV